MKILLWGISPHSYSGFGKVTKIMAHSLQSLGHDVTIVNWSDKWKSSGPFNNIPVTDASVIKNSNNLRILCENAGIELVITIGDLWCHEWIYDLCNAIPMPWVAYQGSEGTNYPVEIFDGKQPVSLKRLQAKISHFWAYTEGTKEALIRSFGRDTQDISVLYHAIYPDKIKDARPFPLKEKLGVGYADKLALFIGDNSKRKGIDIFIKTIENSPGWYGYIHSPMYGDTGYLLSELKTDRVFMKYELDEAIGREYYSNDEIYGMYVGCDLFFHPHRAEGFGLCILEALYAGANVMFTGTAGPKYWLQDSRFHIPVESPVYLDMGGVGYWGENPKILDLNKCKFPLPLKPKFALPARFQHNLGELMKREYNPVLWREL